jgi:hypothetical protein
MLKKNEQKSEPFQDDVGGLVDVATGVGVAVLLGPELRDDGKEPSGNKVEDNNVENC